MKFMKKIMAAVAASAVAAVSVVGASLSAYALQPATGAPYTVYMAVSAGSEQQWNPGEMATTTDASIEKDGDYSCSVTFEKGSATIEYLSLDSNINVYSFVEEGGDPFKDGTAKIKINSIEIKHTDGSTGTIAMRESATSLRTADDGKCLRYSILDNWGSSTHENNIDKDLSSAGGLSAGDTLVVNFNISGIEAGGGTATTDRHLPLRHRRTQIRMVQLLIRARPLQQAKLQLPQQAATAVLPTAAMVVLPTAAITAAPVVLPVPTVPRAVPTM